MTSLVSAKVLALLRGQIDEAAPELSDEIQGMEEDFRELCVRVLGGEMADMGDIAFSTLTAVLKVVEGLKQRVYNILEPNAGDLNFVAKENHLGSPMETAGNKGKALLYSLLPKLNMFSGKIEDGSNFIEMFNIQTDKLTEEEKKAAFGVLCGAVVMPWLKSIGDVPWEELESAFKLTWCKQIQPLQALEELLALNQRDQDYIQTHIAQFEELKGFLRGIVSEEGLKMIFMRSTCHGIRKHSHELEKKNLSWTQLMRVVQELDAKETRPAKKTFPKRNFAMVANEKNEMQELKKMVASLVENNKETSTNGQFQYKCFNCNKMGHKAYDCRAKMPYE